MKIYIWVALLIDYNQWDVFGITHDEDLAAWWASTYPEDYVMQVEVL